MAITWADGLLVGLFLALLQAAPASELPEVDVFLASLSFKDGGAVTLGTPVDISHANGHDTQPAFTPDGRGIFYMSSRGGNWQTDLYRYDVISRETSRITDTPDRESSPTVTRDGKHISFVLSKRDRTQTMWQMELDGGNRTPLAEVNPVGFYAWADAQTLVMFVLGKPPTLQRADTKTGTVDVLAQDIGRSIQPIPKRDAVSFVVREPAASGAGAPTLWIKAYEARTKQIVPLVRAVAGVNDVDTIWTPDGLLLVASGDKLYGWRQGDAELRLLLDLAPLGLHGVSRMAVSPTGDRLAIVAQRPPTP